MARNDPHHPTLSAAVVTAVLPALALREIDREGLLAFYTRNGFKTWRRELEGAAAKVSEPA